MPNRNNDSPGLAAFDRAKDNPLAELADLRRRLEAVERWAMPIGIKWPLPNPPAIKAWRTSSQTIPNNTITDVTALTDQLEEMGLELEGGNIILLRRESAIEEYSVSMSLKWSQATPIGDRQLEIGTRDANTGAWDFLGLDTRTAVTIDDTQLTITWTLFLNTADAIKFRVKHTAGVDLALELFMVDVVMSKSGDVIAS